MEEWPHELPSVHQMDEGVGVDEIHAFGVVFAEILSVVVMMMMMMVVVVVVSMQRRMKAKQMGLDSA